MSCGGLTSHFVSRAQASASCKEVIARVGGRNRWAVAYAELSALDIRKWQSGQLLELLEAIAARRSDDPTEGELLHHPTLIAIQASVAASVFKMAQDDFNVRPLTRLITASRGLALPPPLLGTHVPTIPMNVLPQLFCALVEYGSRDDVRRWLEVLAPYIRAHFADFKTSWRDLCAAGCYLPHASPLHPILAQALVHGRISDFSASSRRTKESPTHHVMTPALTRYAMYLRFFRPTVVPRISEWPHGSEQTAGTGRSSTLEKDIIRTLYALKIRDVVLQVPAYPFTIDLVHR
eukprot:GEMP01049628.1.p1 GENE.GEMP01049628.1~~GEMP01049628.1.p1  ORF type:complete len:292 (+),score=54.24 GEMP01049628.1:95-970(+)